MLWWLLRQTSHMAFSWKIKVLMACPPGSKVGLCIGVLFP